MRSGRAEAIAKHDQIGHFRNVEQGFGLVAAFDKVHAQQLRASVPDTVGLRFGQPRLAVVGEAKPTPVADRVGDVEVQRCLLAATW